jgi:acetyltransferase-like isoleucine patch superfamily enzyme
MRLLFFTRFRDVYPTRGSYIARRVYVRKGALTLGIGCCIGPECWIASTTRLGNFVMLAARVAIVGGDHRMDCVGTPMIYSPRDENRPVDIGDDVWVGYGVTILHGVRIGEGSVIGAGSVVTSDVPAYSVMAGVPARFIRRRFSSHGTVAATEWVTASRLSPGAGITVPYMSSGSTGALQSRTELRSFSIRRSGKAEVARPFGGRIEAGDSGSLAR